LLVNYHPQLSQYQAVLGVETDGDTKVLLTLEFHPTHKPWHAHVCCEDILAAPVGIKRGPRFRNLNALGAKHRMPCPANDESAFNRAVAFFKLDRRDDGGLV
jgi:hypothetical protein